MNRHDIVRTVLGAIAALLLIAAGPATADAPRGKMTGGERYNLPSWFKSSFLDFKEDIAEAKQQGKHLMVFMHLEECPYCARMLRENFVSGPRREMIEKHFDVIGIDIRGTREVAWIDGKTYGERPLAQHLKVVATPAIVFLDYDGNKVLQLNGYREPGAFGDAIDYVRSHAYRKETLATFQERRAQERPASYALRPHPHFTARTDFKGYRKPLAVLFEDRHCVECAAFHEKVLHHPTVKQEMAKLLFVRLDTGSKEQIVDIDGKRKTAGQWAKELGLTYRPAMVLYDEGREIARMDGRLYHFHFSERLRYVSGGHYKRYESYSKYSAARREELLRQGATIDYAE